MIAILNGIVLVAAFFTLPFARPVAVAGSSRELSLRDFDVVGATFLIIGNALILFGVTQGSSRSLAILFIRGNIY